MEGDQRARRRSCSCLYFNPLPPYGGRHQKHDLHGDFHSISIHSLRMEGDPVSDLGGIKAHPISIHSLRMEGDQVTVCVHNRRTQFQSTPSVWRETASADSNAPISMNFNPLPPYGGRLYVAALALKSLAISIHSLRMEGDPGNCVRT